VPELRTRVATSADGTAVEYLSAGRGPDVIVVPGVLAMASDLAAFAKLLAQRFTVHVVQRRGWTDRARREVSAGADLEALTTFVRGTRPDQTRRVPRWLSMVALRHAVSRAELRQNLALLPQAINEYTEAGGLDTRFADYREVAAPTLMMHGKGRGTNRHAVAVARLAETIPHAETMTFLDLDHVAPEKKPGPVADAVLRFFTAHAKLSSGSRHQTAPRVIRADPMPALGA
jgi:hypothetical protein